MEELMVYLAEGEVRREVLEATITDLGGEVPPED